MASHYKGSSNSGYSVLETWDGHNGGHIIKAKALDIVWGADKRYWRLNEDGSAELIQVCWLEVTGSFLADSLGTGKYKLRFDVKMRADAFGWNGCPVRIMLKAGNQAKSVVRAVDLMDAAGSPESSTLIPTEGVEFEIKAGSPTDKVMFGMFEIWRERWKGGMIINKVTIEKLS